MNRQTSLNSFFQSRANPRLVLVNNSMENNNKCKRRSLSLNRPSQPCKSPKTVSVLQETQEVICLSSDSEDLTLPSDRSPERQPNNTSFSSETLLTTQDELSPKNDWDITSNISNDSSQTILYSLSPKKLQTLQKTPSKTPESRKSDKFFSPTKKRLVLKKSPPKRNLSLQFTQESQQSFVTKQGINKETEHKFQDDKTVFLLSIITEYLKKDALKCLLDEPTQELLSKCINIPEPGIRLVCRLYWRQKAWYRVEKLEDIATDKKKYDVPNMMELLKILVENNLFIVNQCNDEDSLDIDGYVKVLKWPEVLQICKVLKLKVQSKQHAADKLKKFSQKSSIINYITGKKGNNYNRVLNMLKSKTGNCYKLSEITCMALYKLYALMYLGIDYNIIKEKRLEFILLHDKSNKETYPVDKNMMVDDASVVFQNRDQFNCYMEAHSMYESYITSDDVQSKCHLVIKAYKEYKNTKEKDMICYQSLPQWLRRFTPVYIYIKILETGVQELKKYKDQSQYVFAVDILDLLLKQMVFRQHKKAEWYAEKALILHKHLNQWEQAAKTLLEGLASNLSVQTKDVIRSRAKRIANQRNIVIDEALRQSLREKSECSLILESTLSADHIYKAPMDNHNQKGKLKFEAHTEDGRSILTAEDYCILHYTHNGEFTHGEHWEGKMVITLFFLLFWDIIYTKPLNISGIFLNHYQRHPLDMYSEDFYNNRKTLIDDRLLFIEGCTDDMMVEMMLNRWEERPEYEISDIYRSAGWNAVESIARCLGPRRVAAICRRLATNYGYTHSGFPDLTLWNVHTKQIKFIEVKTDADKPSMKQLQWLRYLTSHNMAAGFCYVGANTTKCKARAKDNIS